MQCKCTWIIISIVIINNYLLKLVLDYIKLIIKNNNKILDTSLLQSVTTAAILYTYTYF